VKRVVNESGTLSPAQSQSICCVNESEKDRQWIGLEPKDGDFKLLTGQKKDRREGESYGLTG
jgi:hypothetical protein